MTIEHVGSSSGPAQEMTRRAMRPMEHANRHASETANESADSPTLKLGLESAAYSRPASHRILRDRTPEPV
jgi:hypothetical protein